MRGTTQRLQALTWSALATLALLGSAGSRDVLWAQGNIVIARQGNFYVAGEKIYAAVNDGVIGPDPFQNGFPPGHIFLNQAYVQYQIPAERKFRLPIILTHGGGHHGGYYETTPDGREGWSTHFLRKGFDVYVVDDVNRGRSGYDIQDIDAVRLGLEPASAIPRINKYAQENAWTGFRIGPTFGVAYPGSQFPLEAFDQYSNQLVPAYRAPIETVRNVAAFVALFDRIGGSVLVTWSQSGNFGWLTALQRPNLVKAIVALEGGVPNLSAPGNLDVYKKIPILFVIGDHNPNGVAISETAANTLKAAGGTADVLSLPGAGIFGNSHVFVVEKNNLQIADLIIKWLAKNVDDIGGGKDDGKDD